MDSYETTYEPGDEVLLVDSLAGLNGEPGVVERVVRIAPLPHQSQRRLYIVRLASTGIRFTPVSEDVLQPVMS